MIVGKFNMSTSIRIKKLDLSGHSEVVCDLDTAYVRLEQELQHGNFVYISNSKLGVHTKIDKLPKLSEDKEIIVFPPVWGG